MSTYSSKGTNIFRTVAKIISKSANLGVLESSYECVGGNPARRKIMFDRYETINQTNEIYVNNDNRRVYIDRRKVVIVNQIQNQKTPRISKLDKTILIAIGNVIEKISNAQGGRHIAFALIAEVGNELKRMNVQIPNLKDYLESRSDIFRVGQHPKTKALTVSLKKRKDNANRRLAANNRVLLN